MTFPHDLFLARQLTREPSPSSAAASSDDPVDQLKSTLSWRVTAPLRGGKALASELRRRSGSRVDALRSRLLAVAPALIGPEVDPSTKTRDLLRALIDSAIDDEDRIWLLFAGAVGAYPDADEFIALRRHLRRLSPAQRPKAFLAHTVEVLSRTHTHYREVDLRVGETVVDVDFCATVGFTSGVQRVVRETVGRWHERHSVTLLAWDGGGSAMRVLAPNEEARVSGAYRLRERDFDMRHAESVMRTVIPWRCNVVLPEVARERYSRSLISLARFSGNRVRAIGYDMIPAVDGFFVDPAQSQSFARYLTLVKHVDEVVAISEAVAEEFRGFVDALTAQGVTGPTVSVVPLSEEVSFDDVDAPKPIEVPLVLAVGSHEIRKNQIAVADAAERLWRDGLRFSLLFAGGPGPEWYTDLDDRVTELVLDGRSVAVVQSISDEEMRRAYRTAHVQVFVSLHEGFGLPVVEALAAGTPVITSRRGSMGEMARAGGCIAVDPEDVGEIAEALRRVLTDDAEYGRLVAEIGERPSRTWDDYADAVWARMTEVSR
ncbi:glycosyltransferase [Homoserinibacter sp. GY 40078]|uniref:glycosyltransferase n=1 Tax=Homoserinibacter sp. GY 40078 TaxID=2603275 RepID=UPI0011CA028B|nr:glycosyltransferase [Homoserinibacter sp. GY 40078]TXK16261.1 glycosyltransferase family 4 protein [Homoserinibacter sp. GY 40078]